MSRRWNSSRRYDPALHKQAMNMMAPHEYVVHSLTDGVDAVAKEMERKWGVDRLRLLVNDLLRAKFDSQLDRFNTALADGNQQYIEVQAEAMKRAWQKLDQAATETGQKPLSPNVWECKLPESGRIIALVRTPSEAHHVAAPDREVWTMEEVGRLIENFADKISEIKQVFPGAELTAFHKKQDTEPSDKDGFDWAKGDDIPF
jgi:hypothetical protein